MEKSLSLSSQEKRLEAVLLDVEGVCGLLGPEDLAAGAAGAGAAAADEDEEHEACKQGNTDEMGNL